LCVSGSVDFSLNLLRAIWEVAVLYTGCTVQLQVLTISSANRIFSLYVRFGPSRSPRTKLGELTTNITTTLTMLQAQTFFSTSVFNGRLFRQDVTQQLTQSWKYSLTSMTHVSMWFTKRRYWENKEDIQIQSGH
jgi:hypothetical protein